MEYKRLINEKIQNLLYRLKHLKKRTKICLVVSIICALFSFLLNKDSIYVKPYEIKRGEYGTEKAKYRVYLNAENLKNNLEFDISVSPKRYTKTEIDAVFKDKFDKLLISMLNENVDYEHVCSKLDMSTSVGDGISASYFFEPYYENATNSDVEAFTYYTKYQNLIDGSGNIKNDDFKIDEICKGYIIIQLSAEIKDKDGLYKSKKYMVPVTVVSKEQSELESFKSSFRKEVLNNDKLTIDNNTITLPKVINNFRIVYKDKLDLTFLLMPLFGILIVILLEAKDKEKVRDKEKEDKKKLENDFSQIIGKLLLYVSSGMTIRNSMIKISTEYQKKLMKKEIDERKAYEEICIVKNKLLSGYSEAKAYEDMAKNINLRTYTRFLNILIQSLKNGNKDFKNILSMEVQDALYERKQRAKKLGEEASTKLVLPLMLMLSVIMVIIMVPTFMGM